MDCKRALVETDGDVEAAQRCCARRAWRRPRKRAGRETTEGEVLATVAGDRGTIVAVGCETEPVSKNDEFLAFAEDVLEAVERGGPDAVAALEEERLELVGEARREHRRRRRRALRGGRRRAARRVRPPAGEQDRRARPREGRRPRGCARELAMHLSFAAPALPHARRGSGGGGRRRARDLRELAEVQRKPEQVREKIVEGRCSQAIPLPAALLGDQPWIRDPSKTVGQGARRGAGSRCSSSRASRSPSDRAGGAEDASGRAGAAVFPASS